MESLVVVLGTTSALKLSAIKQAFVSKQTKIFEALHLSAEAKFEFVPTAAASEINEQPFGYEEIIKGATNRASNALKLAKIEPSKPRIVIAIENGVIEVPTGAQPLYMDIGWVVMKDLETGAQYNSSSTGVLIPTEVWEETKKLGFEKKTIGDAMHARDPTISTKDPHTALLGYVLTRTDMMEQAVVACIGQWIRSLK